MGHLRQVQGLYLRPTVHCPFGIFRPSFTVLTDNNPVTYVLTTAKSDATGHRWKAALVAFNFDKQYRPGRNNADEDDLSRLPISIEAVQAISTSMVSRSHIENLTVNPEVVLDDYDPRGTGTWNLIDWEKFQHLDPDHHSTSTFSEHHNYFSVRTSLHGRLDTGTIQGRSSTIVSDNRSFH